MQALEEEEKTQAKNVPASIFTCKIVSGPSRLGDRHWDPKMRTEEPRQTTVTYGNLELKRCNDVLANILVNLYSTKKDSWDMRLPIASYNYSSDQVNRQR